MAHTIPTEFVGVPEVTKERLDIIKEWYRSTLADSDKADTAEDESWYIGQALAFESALRLLHGMPMNDNDEENSS